MGMKQLWALLLAAVLVVSQDNPQVPQVEVSPECDKYFRRDRQLVLDDTFGDSVNVLGVKIPRGPWSSDSAGGLFAASYSKPADSPYMIVNVTNSGTEFNSLQFIQELNFTANQPIQISFVARTQSGVQRRIQIGTDSGKSSDLYRFEHLCGKVVLTLDGDFREHNFCCVPPESDNGRIIIEFGANTIEENRNVAMFWQSFRVYAGAIDIPGATTSEEGGSENYALIAIICAVGIFVAIAIIGIAFLSVFWSNKRKSIQKAERRARRLQARRENLKDSQILFPDLVIEKEIGRGYYGVVHKGKYGERDVAIKKLSENMVKKAKLELEMFTKEAQLMAKLPKSKFLVAFVGFTLPPDPVAIVTDFYNGGSLFDYLERQELDEDNQIMVAIHIAKGMKILHKGIEQNGKILQVIHRDLASRNVLLELGITGVILRACVSDFGMSRLKAEDDDDASMTVSEIGAVNWMAPEQFKTGKPYSTKTDVWSYGATLWEITQRKAPFQGMAPPLIIGALTSGRYPIVDNPKCPPIIKEVIEACFQRKPSKRPSFETILEMFDRSAKNRQSHRYSRAIAPKNMVELMELSSEFTKSTATQPDDVYFKSPQNLASFKMTDDERSEAIYASTPADQSGTNYLSVSQAMQKQPSGRLDSEIFASGVYKEMPRAGPTEPEVVN